MSRIIEFSRTAVAAIVTGVLVLAAMAVAVRMNASLPQATAPAINAAAPLDTAPQLVSNVLAYTTPEAGFKADFILDENATFGMLQPYQVTFPYTERVINGRQTHGHDVQFQYNVDREIFVVHVYTFSAGVWTSSNGSPLVESELTCDRPNGILIACTDHRALMPHEHEVFRLMANKFYEVYTYGDAVSPRLAKSFEII